MDTNVAIVTWWQGANYGSVLQAYSLQKILESWGYESELIGFAANALRRFVYDIEAYVRRPKAHQVRTKFARFRRENLKSSPKYWTYNQLKHEASKRYSAAIAGSDQIWCCAGGHAKTLYYLSFIDANKRIAYAPSIGYNYIPTDCADDFRKYVSEIPFVSVREEHGAALIREVVGREAKVVVDPSLLLTAEQWKAKIKMPSEVTLGDNYILCYFLRDNPEYSIFARALSDLTGYRIAAIEPASCKEYISLRGIETVAADPFDFVRLIDDASYVLTDSFHGVAFSINLGKHFGVFKRFHDDDPISQNSRIYNILKKTGLVDRLVSANVVPSDLTRRSIDYDSVRSLLGREREQSLAYLKEALTAATDY
jgi:hypothetical protein